MKAFVLYMSCFTLLAMIRGYSQAQTLVPPQPRIAYVSQQDGSREWVYIMNADGTGSQLVFEDTELGFGVLDLACSRDGQHLAVTLPGGRIAIVNTDTYEFELLRLPYDEFHFNYDGIDWSPDGSQLVFSNGIDLYRINADGNDLYPVTKERKGFFYPVWSPDGTLIAFSDYENDQYKLRSIDARGHVQDIAQSDFPDIDWSPDGDLIYLTLADDVQQNSLVIASVEQLGSPQGVRTEVRISPDGFITSPKISPNGAEILYTLYHPELEGSDIYVMDADGTNIRRLTNRYGQDRNPCWLP